MNKIKPTWKDLYDHIATMSEQEKNQPVLIWGEETPLSDNVSLCCESEDMVYDPEDPDPVCGLRSEYDCEGDPEIALPAGTTY